MKICIGNYDCTEVWDGVFYKKLSDFPNITDWEIRTILEFVEYEKKYNRTCQIECDNQQLLDYINTELANVKKYKEVNRPKLLTECTACPMRQGCETEFVCHTTSLENAISILKCGSLLSAVKARGISANELSKEPRNAARDPEDYFEYIMFTWGNCQAGDRLVMERKLSRFPNEQDLSTDFTPGIRFYFKYDEMIKHPECVFDGVLPFKIKDEVILENWVYAVVVPETYKNVIEKFIPSHLVQKVLYVKNECNDIWDWSEKVYSIIEKIKYEGTP